jgi:hypothetical protein
LHQSTAIGRPWRSATARASARSAACEKLPSTITGHPAGLDDELDFPVRVEELPRFIAALRRECARPQCGQIGRLIAMAEALRLSEGLDTDALPWSTF